MFVRGAKVDWEKLNAWEIYGETLDTEYRQCDEEGLDAEALKPLFDAISALPRGDFRETLADELYKRICELPTRAGYAYDEPSDLSGIRARRAPAPKLGAVDWAHLESRLLGAWQGRVCGCLFGKPLEGLRKKRIAEVFENNGGFPAKGYLDDPANDGRAWAHAIDGACPVDDDTNYTALAAHCVVGKKGADFTPADVANAWLDCQPKNAYCTAERVCFVNFTCGLTPPESATYKNPFREWIGAQIRADYYGYICPGDPERAAEMAWRDASISHIKNGIYGAMWVAAALAAAATADDIELCLRAGLAQVPEKSRFFEEVASVLNWHKQGASRADAFARIEAKYDENSPHDWCHTIPNAMIVAAALLYGAGDYAQTVSLAVRPGFDTDCNAATAGSILGMLGVCVPESFTLPIRDTLRTSIFGMENVKITELAAKTYHCAAEFSKARL